METITVLPVGNGACSVLRHLPGPWRPARDPGVSIVDCGSGTTLGRSPAEQLDGELSIADWTWLDSLVVTHWDADHWRGLHHLANSKMPGDLPLAGRSLPIYCPAVPFDLPSTLPADTMALISVTSSSGVEGIDLEDAWRVHADAYLDPKAAGDWITLAGREYQVVWPPTDLEGRLTRKAERVVSDIQDLAKGRPILSEAIEKAYTQKKMSERQREQPDRTTSAATLRQADQQRFKPLSNPGYPQRLDIEEELPSEDSLEDVVAYVNDEQIPAPQSHEDEPRRPPILRDLSPDERRLAGDARKLQNTLSLIFHDPLRGALLVYGDAPPAVVRHVVDKLEPYYGVVLAPHHGTQRMPKRARTPENSICIAQGGETDFRNLWIRDHLDSHMSSWRCVHVSDWVPRGVQVPLRP